MRSFVALGLAASIGLVWCQSAGAVPAGAMAAKEAARAASALQQVQYYERHTRRGIVKCYRDFVVGPYRCHRFRYW